MQKIAFSPLRGRSFKTSTAYRGVGVFEKSMYVDMRGPGDVDTFAHYVLISLLFEIWAK